MAEYPVGQERLLKELISTFRCQVCRRSFEGEHVRVAARHEQLWIVSVRCRACRKQHVFYVAPNNIGGGFLRDITQEEEEQFAAMSAVTGDEVLDMHQFLTEFDGDFKGLFGD